MNNHKYNIVIISLARSGSSMLTNLIKSSGYKLDLYPGAQLLSGSEFNSDGYFEDISINLLNDQIIRMSLGSDASFLYLPKGTIIENNFIKNASDFNYDIDEASIYFPDGFNENIEKYTGKKWDVWGLTRMQSGGKWHKAYSRHGIATGKGVLLKLEWYRKLLNENVRCGIIKDARLGLTLNKYRLDPEIHKIVHIKRESNEVIKSLRRHFGAQLFTQNFLPGRKAIVSNHFNYQIGCQPFDEYLRLYNSMICKNIEGYKTLEVSYEKIIDGSDIPALENFIGGKINREIIKR